MLVKIKYPPALAILAAALYALSTPFSKLLLEHVGATMLAALLYLGAGLGLLCIRLLRTGAARRTENQPLSKSDIPYIITMILLDIAAPVLLLLGLQTTPAASASLLNNFEIAATALTALLVFREKISPRLWLGILCVTASCILLFPDGTRKTSAFRSAHF